MKKSLLIRIKGIVQGVGFRPFVYQLARKNRITGSVLNDTEGVIIHADGGADDLERFLARLKTDAPPLAMIMSVDADEAPPSGRADFGIDRSRITEERLAFYSPDVAVCDQCRVEFSDPSDRRHHYPFITCINCGPRFSIVRDIPYDRTNTSMDPFPMCDRCLAEYTDPEDRRFHSQPNACPVCGPSMALYTGDRVLVASDTTAVAEQTVALLKQGAVLAIKGIGGYHLAADARNDAVIMELRKRKRRPFKPFAIMAGSIEAAAGFCDISPEERDLLLSKERPIVLLRETMRHISSQVAPGLTYLGLMLPYTPFQHHLFAIDPALVLVMTSGNVSDEPIEYRDETVFERLGRIADYFVTYNREIIGQGDDSVLYVVDRTPYFIRRSRGYIPVPFLSGDSPENMLATGGDLKNSFALARKNFIIMSQYLGDMADPLTYEVFRRTVGHFIRIFDAEPEVIVTDMHPAYLTRQHAEELASLGKRLIEVQHHHAHVASVMEEHGLDDAVIGIAFDGTGYGTDGTLWGSEFLVTRRDGFERAAHFEYFPLPGGENAIKDVWKIGLSLLYQHYGDAYPVMERNEASAGVIEILKKNINSPLTCSIGRLFDGVAAILDISRSVSAEAEAAQLLEEAAMRGRAPEQPFIIPFSGIGSIVIGTGDLVARIVSLIEKGMKTDDIAADFHQAIIHTTAAVADRIRATTGINGIALSGGVFHNRILLGGIIRLLREKGFMVYTHKQVPCNDGCIALGQLAVAKKILSW